MSRATRLLPSHVLSEVRRMLEVEIVSQPVTGTIEISRSGLVLAFAALADVAAEVEVLEEGADATDRLTRELAIAHAEIERLQLQLVARDIVDGSRPRLRLLSFGSPCEVIDLSVELGREMGRAASGQPGGPEGGTP